MATEGIGYIRDVITGRLQFVGRLKRPAYYTDADPTTLIKVDASVSKPVTLVLGSKLVQLTSNLRCNLNNTGAGGLDAGSLTANTPYYMYIVDNSGTPALVASVLQPSDGPRGFKDWTYIGAAATNSGSADFNIFKAANGVHLNENELEEETAAAGSGRTQLTFLSMPKTIQHAYMVGIAVAGASSLGESVQFHTADSSADLTRIRISTASQNRFTQFWIPINTDQSIWLTPDTNTTGRARLIGWREDPTEWQ